MIKKLLMALSLLAILTVYGCSSAGHNNIQGNSVTGTGINRGDLAPDFSVNTINGKSVSLSELSADKPTVVYFFATWCPNCARDFAAVKDVYPRYSDKVNFLAVDMDQRESESQITSYSQKLNIPGIEFAAAKRDVLANYNVVYTTTKYFIGKDGSILNKGVGGIDAATWEQIFQSMSQY